MATLTILYEEFHRLFHNTRWFMETDHMDQFWVMEAIEDIAKNPVYVKDWKTYRRLVEEWFAGEEDADEDMDVVKSFFSFYSLKFAGRLSSPTS